VENCSSRSCPSPDQVCTEAIINGNIVGTNCVLRTSLIRLTSECDSSFCTGDTECNIASFEDQSFLFCVGSAILDLTIEFTRDIIEQTALRNITQPTGMFLPKIFIPFYC